MDTVFHKSTLFCMIRRGLTCIIIIYLQLFLQKACLSCRLFSNNNEKLIYQDPVGQSKLLKGERTFSLLFWLVQRAGARWQYRLWILVKWVVRGWFVGRCYHAAGQQRPHSGKRFAEHLKNISRLVFLLIMKMFISFLQHFFFFFLIVTSHFDMGLFAMPNLHSTLRSS